MLDNIPSKAIPIRYCYGKSKGLFHVWQSSISRSRWQWSALGNSGEEGGQEEAINSARKWIISKSKSTQGD